MYLLKPLQSFKGVLTRPCLAGAAVKTLLVVTLFALGYLQFERYFKNILIRNAQAEVSQQLHAMVKHTESLLNQRLTDLTAMRAYTDLHGEEEDFPDRFMAFAGKLYQETKGIRNFIVSPGGINRLVYPPKGHEALVGDNLLEDDRPEVQGDIRRCMTTDAIVMGTPYRSNEGGIEVAARQGIFREGRFWGLVTMNLDWEYILANIQAPANLHVGIRSNTGKVFCGNSDVFYNNGVLQLIKFPGSYWEFGALPSGGWEGMIAVELMTARTVAVFLLLVLAWGTFVIFNNQTNLTEQAQLINRILQLLGEDRQSYRQYVIFPAYKVVIFYLLLGGSWILFSDRFLMALGNHFELETFTRFQTYKGWIYVIATAFSIYLLIQHYLKIIYLSSEGRLQTSGLLYQSLTSNFPNGAVCLFDREMHVVSMEGTGLDCLERNISRQEIKLFHERFPEPVRSELRRLCEAALEGRGELPKFNAINGYINSISFRSIIMSRRLWPVWR